MELGFIKVNIAENMTVYITDPVERSLHAAVAQKIMEYGSLHAEQVGFYEPCSLPGGRAVRRLQMMGGEFCGNATRGMGALLLRSSLTHWDENIPVEIAVETSGSDVESICRVERRDHNHYIVSMQMPDPRRIYEQAIQFNGTSLSYVMVEYPGITHAVLLLRQELATRENFQVFLSHIPHEDADAFGLMLFDPNKNYLTPAVYVKETGSFVYEKSCGSGSAAVGAALAYLRKRGQNLEIAQEGGVLSVESAFSGHTVGAVFLKGNVVVVAEGKVYID